MHFSFPYQSSKLLIWGLTNFDTIKIIKKNEIISNLDVWLGNKKKVQVVSKENYFLTIPKRKKKTIKAIIEYEGPLNSPISKGDKIGLLNIYVSGDLKKQISIFSNEEIKRANIFSRLFISLNYLVWGDV